MNIINVPRINALGLSGPEEMGKMVLSNMGREFETIEVDNFNVESSEYAIFSRAKQIFENNGKSVFVGGDHSITYPIFKAFSEVKKNAFLIVFDAHADCDYSSKEPTHEEWLRAIIERGFDASRVILIGVRKIWEVEKKFLIDNGVKVFEEVRDIESIAGYIIEKASGFDVYVSIDIDVIDPLFAPAVNYPEPNGITPVNFFYLIKRVFRIKGLSAIDIVEAVPEKDKIYGFKTTTLVAEIVENFLGVNRI